MTQHAAITVYRSRKEVEQLWREPRHRGGCGEGVDARVRFADAAGDRGTEIHVEIVTGRFGGRLGEIVQKVIGAEPRAHVMDHLRRFKQLVETGEIARSDGAPEGEQAERKFAQRPAQPLPEADFAKVKVGV